MIEAGYARVSSDEQARDSNALTQQVNRLLRSGVEEIYCDVQSGKDDDRPDFERLLNDMRLGIIKRITITRDDRITRRGLTTLQLLDDFCRYGVELRILDGAGTVDLANPYHWHQRATAGLNAEFEIRMLSMRIKAGFEEFRREGKANPKPPWGFKRVDESYQVADYEAVRGSVDLFLELKTLSATIRAIDERYGKQWSANGFRRWLLNPVLRGHTAYPQSKEIRYNTHSAIITSEFEEIHSILKENKQYWGANQQAPKHPLGGLLFCGECGTKCTVARGGNHLYVWCRQRKQKLLSKPCSQRKTPRYELIESAVITALLTRSQAIANLAAVADQPTETPELQALRAELHYYQAAPGGRAAAIVAELQQQIEGLKLQQSTTTQSQVANRELLNQCFGDRSTWECLMTPEEKRDVYRALVERVMIWDGQVQSVSLKC